MKILNRLFLWVGIAAIAGAGVAVSVAVGAPRSRPFKKLQESCFRALMKADPTDQAESLAAHSSHESVWEVRYRLWRLLPQEKLQDPVALKPWADYLENRYGVLRSRYPADSLQRLELDERIQLVAAGSMAELGELQMVEMYWSDPNVERVEMIPRTPQHATPDLWVVFKEGGSKLVEVKTRAPGYMPDLLHFEEQLPKANAQFRNYQAHIGEFDRVRTEIALIYHFSNLPHVSAREMREGIAEVDQELVSVFERLDATTRVALFVNNRPFMRVTRSWRRGVWGLHREVFVENGK